MKKSSKSILGIALAAAVMLGAVAGCTTTTTTSSAAASSAAAASAAASSAAASSKAAPTGPITLNVWTDDRSAGDFYKTKVDEFNKSNTSQITVKYTIYAENFQTIMDLAFAANQLPDLFKEKNYDKYVSQGYFLPLNKYLTDAYKARFPSGTFMEGINMLDGQIYSIGYQFSTCRLIYNKDIFAKAGIASAPKSLDELVADATTISTKLSGEGIYGFAANLKSPSSALQRQIPYIATSSGLSNVVGFNFSTNKYSFAEFKPIIEAYKKIFTSNAAFPGCESLDIDPLRTQFAAGKIGMYISYQSIEPTVYANQFPTEQHWDEALVPTIDGTIKGANTCGGMNRLWVINSKTADPDRAWKVFEYFYSDEFLKALYESGNSMVAIDSVSKTATAPKAYNGINNIFAQSTDCPYPANPAGVTPEGKDCWTLFASMMFGQTADIDATLADLTTRYQAAYDKAIAAGTTKKITVSNWDAMHPDKATVKFG